MVMTIGKISDEHVSVKIIVKTMAKRVDSAEWEKLRQIKVKKQWMEYTRHLGPVTIEF